MSAPDSPRPAAPASGPLRSASLWRKLAMTAAAGAPPLGLIVAVPFVNRPAPIVLGLPFFQFWTTVCVALTGVCLTLVFHLDPRNSVPTPSGEPRVDEMQGAPRRRVRSSEERAAVHEERSNAADRRADPGDESC